MLGVDDVKFAPPDDRVCEWNGVGYFLVFVPSNNGSCNKAPVDEVVNDPDGVLITETPEIILVSIEQ